MKMRSIKVRLTKIGTLEILCLIMMPLSSNDLCTTKTDCNLSAEALCLDTHQESIINDELEIEPCYEYFDANMQGLDLLPVAKE